MVGIAEHVGDAMTYKILTVDTQKVTYHSNLCSASSSDPNLHVDILGGQTSSPPAPLVVKSCHDDADGESKALNMPDFHPIDLVGHTFLLDPQEDGQCFHARILGLSKMIMRQTSTRTQTASSSYAQSMMMPLRK